MLIKMVGPNGLSMAPIAPDVVGAFVGAVGICIAIYLQMVSPRAVSPTYSLAFFTFGAAFMLYNITAFAPESTTGTLRTARFVGSVLALMLELAGATYVIRHTEVRSPHRVLLDALPSSRRRRE